MLFIIHIGEECMHFKAFLELVSGGYKGFGKEKD